MYRVLLCLFNVFVLCLFCVCLLCFVFRAEFCTFVCVSYRRVVCFVCDSVVLFVVFFAVCLFYVSGACVLSFFFARKFVFLCGFGRRVLFWLVGVPHGCCALVLVVFLLCLCCASVL